MENKLSSRIKGLRTSLNMTQAAFSESIGTSQNALSGYETKDRIPSYDILISIATKYNVSLDWLCGLSDIKSLSHNVATYSDLFKILLQLFNTKYTDDNSNCIKNFSFSSNIATLNFYDPSRRIKTFIQEWHKMYNLYTENTIDDELYSLWLDKKLNDVYDIPLDTRPDFMLLDTDSTIE